jgi:NAD(P)-dependent dehydrogenase (short-subunit alcohol dehydrogenase family)
MEQRAVLVTGASSGIGKETVLLLARKGFRVFAGVRRPQDGKSLVREASGSLTPLIIDVTDGASIQAAAQTIAAALGTEECLALVNNAGIAVAGPLEILPLDELRRQFEVNVFGQVAVTKAFLPLLRSHRGRIVFMGSLFGRIAVPLAGPYSAAKFALEAVADSLAVELHPWKIRVTILEPGNIATPIWDKFKNGAAEIPRRDADDDALYGDVQGSALRLAEFFSKSGLTPARVAAAVHRVLNARHPRSRYLVGWDAQILGRIAPASPARLRYWVIRRIIAPK